MATIDLRTGIGRSVYFGSLIAAFGLGVGTLYLWNWLTPVPTVQTVTTTKKEEKKAEVPAAPKTCPTRTYTMVQGDWLIKQARIEYGNKGEAENYRNGFRLGKYNKIADPNTIRVGKIITVPCLEDLLKVENFLPPSSKAESKAEILSEWEGKLASNTRKRFIAPARFIAEVATIDPPETLRVEVELPMFATALPILAQPLQAEQIETTDEAYVPLQQVAFREKEAGPPALISAEESHADHPITIAKKSSNVKGYEVALHIPSGQVQGASAGVFSALLLENQDKFGEWQKWKKISVELKEDPNGLLCTIILNKAPPQNSAVAIDFANGHSIFIASDLLAQGELTTQHMAKARSRKTYSALALANRLKPNTALNALRFVAPTVMRSGLAFALTGPLGLVMAPASFATDIATAKIRKSQRLEQQANQPRIAVEYAIAGQASQIEKLEHEVEMLKMQITSSGQKRNQLASNVEERE